MPLTRNVSRFEELCVLGQELVELHLLRRECPQLVKYPVPGSNAVERVQYNDMQRQVWINKEQYFEGIKPDVWEFMIGGYQVCQKWLKDRKGRELSYDERKLYPQIVSSLSEIIRLMGEIDACVQDKGGFPLR